MRVLLVEDHPDSRRVLAVLLRSLGHDVVPADSVGEATRAAADGIYDCAIIDLHLPDGSGIDLYRELAATRSCMGLALTGSDGPDVVEACRAAGFRYHLVKPLNFEDLKRMLSAFQDELGRRGT